MPVSGAWRLSYSMSSHVAYGNSNYAFIYINGNKLPETEHKIYGDIGRGDHISGRVVILEASAKDTIELRATRMHGEYSGINFCAEHIFKM